MTNDEVVERLRPVTANLFGAPMDLGGDTKLRSLPGWESIRHLHFILAIEDTFGVELDPADIESLDTLNDAAAAVVKRMG